MLLIIFMVCSCLPSFKFEIAMPRYVFFSFGFSLQAYSNHLLALAFIFFDRKATAMLKQQPKCFPFNLSP